ncbi:hypothetical protein [Butyrivibrio sp. FCS014]|uniref:hypothetical protein n=1 Tax=Butyrivibrio sp. FCS014 TaxID=1408304 RepID=UPI000463EBA7|nr:hypothetical protein [Butyrivibrio sp. FCS014]
MAKNDKELEQISTTDKLKAFKALKDAGYRVELNGSGVPTVVCAAASDMSKELKNIRRILKELRYIGSFGVRGPRKNEQTVPDEMPKGTAGEEPAAEGEAIPA